MFGRANLELTKNPWLMRRARDGVDFIFRLSRLPLLRRFHPWTDPATSDMRWLPINQAIEMPEGVPLPPSILDRCIEEASHRVIIDYCGCRKASVCGHYPVEVGCLLLGDTAVRAARSISREVGVEEAKEHARRAMEAGLIPAVGTARVDNLVFNVEDPARMLTVCFCCECCCIMRYTRHTPMKYLEPTFPRLEGVAVEVTETCTGCGTCAGHCYMKAIEIVGGRARIDEKCRACGRCASVCPSEAIRVSVDDPEFLEKCYRRIRSYVDIGPSSP